MWEGETLLVWDCGTENEKWSIGNRVNQEWDRERGKRGDIDEQM